MPVLQHC